jgi:hypothetical protein
VSTGSSWAHEGFEIVEHPGARVLARPESVAWVRFVLEGGQSLHQAAGGDRSAVTLEGRYPVYIIPAKVPSSYPVDEERWAVRHYARGGRASKVLVDRYIRVGGVRPYQETEASEAARARGIPTPRVMAAALYPDGVFYRADLVTAFVPNSSDLVETLFDMKRMGAGGSADRLDALAAAGGLIRDMAAAGIRHRDMNARNVLLEWKGATPRAHLLDLDRCRVASTHRPISTAAMHQRLLRSLRKWEKHTGVRITDKEWETLDQAVAG